jgi:hypothetical protein
MFGKVLMYSKSARAEVGSTAASRQYQTNLRGRRAQVVVVVNLLALTVLLAVTPVMGGSCCVTLQLLAAACVLAQCQAQLATGVPVGNPLEMNELAQQQQSMIQHQAYLNSRTVESSAKLSEAKELLANVRVCFWNAPPGALHIGTRPRPHSF